MPVSGPTLGLERALNPQQLEAVTHGEGPQLVLAGAGSGKTRVITYRIAWLIQSQGVDPSHIAAVTFTNKAAAEMRERVEDLLQLFPLPVFVGTFHRYALGLLRRYGERLGLLRDFGIMDTSDQLTLIKQALELEGISDKAFPPRAVLAAISSAKNRLLDPSVFEAQADDFFSRKVAVLYRRYQGLLSDASGVDFDDMLVLAVRLLQREADIRERIQRRTRFLLVDEFQDTNHVQLELIRALVGSDGNLTAVGDEDQGIYRWRGAELANILEFEDSFPGATIRKLERNYRSTQTILDASGAVVAHNTQRRGKTLWTDTGAGDAIELFKAGDEGDEARWVVTTLMQMRSQCSYGDMAVLMRTNAQSRSLEEELLRQQVPYVLVGGTRFYDRAEIKDLVAYLRVLRNPRDTFSLLRILNQPPRGIGKATQDRLRGQAADQGKLLWDILYLEELSEFSSRSAKALKGFRDLIVSLQEAARDLPLPELLRRILDTTHYADLYSPDDAEDQGRLENIEELLSAAEELAEASRQGEAFGDSLTAFLDHVSLVSDLDSWQSEAGVSVMTLHSAKGLEFQVVAITGLEDGLLPHFNSQGTDEALEEERRLLYVGMTRARQHLYLSCCQQRRIAGRYQDQQESPFLEEIPEDLLRVTQSPEIFASDRFRGVYSFFDRPDGGSRSLEDSGAEVTGLGKGSRVRHPTLGQGVVLEVDGSGDHAKITVFFERSGKRKLVAKYANLEAL